MRFERQRQHKRRSGADHAFDVHVAAKQPRQAARDRQPETGAGRDSAGRPGLLEGLEDALAIALSDADAGILHGDPPGTTLGIERELREGTLAFVPLVDPELKPSHLTIISSALRPQAPSTNLMIEALRAAAAKLLT